MRNICITAEVLSIELAHRSRLLFRAVCGVQRAGFRTIRSGAAHARAPQPSPLRTPPCGEPQQPGGKGGARGWRARSLTPSFQPHSFGRCVLGPRRPGPTLAGLPSRGGADPPTGPLLRWAGRCSLTGPSQPLAGCLWRGWRGRCYTSEDPYRRLPAGASSEPRRAGAWPGQEPRAVLADGAAWEEAQCIRGTERKGEERQVGAGVRRTQRGAPESPQAEAGRESARGGRVLRLPGRLGHTQSSWHGVPSLCHPAQLPSAVTMGVLPPES